MRNITPERWRQIDTIVQAALERPPTDRPTFVAEACGSDASLREEVESLLARDTARAFLEPPRPGTDDVAKRLAAGLAGRYDVDRLLGRGGMAAVYLARDIRQRRAVAIKVLHPELSAILGSERFLREIELTASLQHPHILPLFDSGTADGLLYYAMPFVAGESLRARLARELQLPVADAVRIAKEAAGALEYAHRHGVVHRDIKPENILLAEDGSALVADFGIALAVRQAGGDRLTQTGLSLGTPQYMAPEQATGERTVDARADVYALGAVLYEMLAGAPPFTGPTAQAIIVKALAEAPTPLTELRRTVPPQIAAAAHTALEKLPADRFPTAAAFASALDGAAPLGTGAAVRLTGPTSVSRRTTRLSAIATAAALLLTAALGFLAGRRNAVRTARGPVRFTIEPDSTAPRLGALAISPDGQTVVYAGEGSDGGRLYSRRLDELVSRPVPGTENGDFPFFSPDGAWLGFFSNGAIRKLRLAGGAPVVVLATNATGGASWGGSGIVFAGGRQRSGLSRVPAEGGRESRVQVADTSFSILNPHLLPGETAALVTITRDFNGGRVAVLDLTSGKLTDLGPGAGPRYVAGSILYVGPNGELFRRRFDLKSRRPVGTAEQIASGLDAVTVSLSVSTVSFDASPTGALAFRVGPAESSEGNLRLVVTDRGGQVERAIAARVPWAPRLSPSGSRVAYGAFAPGRDSSDVWVTDLRTGATQRVTTDGRDNNDPQWSPDEREIAYSTDVPGGKDIIVQPLDGRPAHRFERPEPQWPSDWTSDGAAVVFTDVKAGGYDIWMQPIANGPARSLVATPAQETAARVSRDGRWIAYQSDETGRYEVYVQSFSLGGQKTLVSTSGGVNPVWSWDGRLYYWKADQLIEARVEAGAQGGPLEVRERRRMFRAPYFDNVHAMYDVTRDGNRFVMVTGGARTGRIVVALDVLRTDQP
jgi:serine/threonine-protein kinase